MPNYCDNELIIKGSSGVLACVEAIKGEPDDDGRARYVDFQKIVPMPAILDEHAARPTRGGSFYSVTMPLGRRCCRTRGSRKQASPTWMGFADTYARTSRMPRRRDNERFKPNKRLVAVIGTNGGWGEWRMATSTGTGERNGMPATVRRSTTRPTRGQPSSSTPLGPRRSRWSLSCPSSSRSSRSP